MELDRGLTEKVARLPVWAREHIKNLEAQAAPNNDELRILRQRVAYLEGLLRKSADRQEVMLEVFRAAARGGHETAQAFVDRIVSEWCSEGPPNG